MTLDQPEEESWFPLKLLEKVNPRSLASAGFAGWPGAAGSGCAVGGYDGIGVYCATRRYGAAGDFSSRGRLSKTGRCQHCAQQRNQKPMNYIHFSSHKKTGFTVVGGALLA